MSDRSSRFALGLLSALLSGVAVTATPMDELEVLTGRVAEILPQQMLVLEAGERRVLVYSNARDMAELSVGSTVRIEGQVPRDWLRLSRDELQARRISRVADADA